TEWQQRWDANVGRMRDEELDTEKSHMAVLLTPRSRRMQYGLDLTRALLGRIEDLTRANRSRLVILQAETEAVTRDSADVTVYVLNGKYYRTSKRQAKDNWQYVNEGFAVEVVPVILGDWRVSV